MPNAACRFMQAIYLEKIDGNVKIDEIVERLANIDREDESRLVFEDTKDHWRKQTIVSHFATYQGL